MSASLSSQDFLGFARLMEVFMSVDDFYDIFKARWAKQAKQNRVFFAVMAVYLVFLHICLFFVC